MRKAKILVVARSDFVHTSQSLFWLDVKMAIGVQRQTEMNPITIVFDNVNRGPTAN